MNTVRIKVYVEFDVPVDIDTETEEETPTFNQISNIVDWGIDYIADTHGWDTVEVEIK